MWHGHYSKGFLSDGFTCVLSSLQASLWTSIITISFTSALSFQFALKTNSRICIISHFIQTSFPDSHGPLLQPNTILGTCVLSPGRPSPSVPPWTCISLKVEVDTALMKTVVICIKSEHLCTDFLSVFSATPLSMLCSPALCLLPWGFVRPFFIYFLYVLSPLLDASKFKAEKILSDLFISLNNNY